MKTDPLHAVTRFGLGAKPDEALPSDPVGWLGGQLGAADPVRFPPNLPGVADGLILLAEQRRLRPPPGESFVEPVYRAEMAAQLGALLDAQAPFRERLVWFWANHFTVSIRANPVRPIAGAFVREAIRPHVTGRFGDMLLAVMRHPAMLLYLDNANSVGPNSPAGQNGKRGLNENLARECLELHTLSPAAGYTQADVTAFATILTGWSVVRQEQALDDVSGPMPGFVFRERAHEPGDKTLLGRRFPEGEAGGILALDMLANHPATTRHLARKLATHFVSDTPSAATVARLDAVLAGSGGDLGAVCRALIALPEAWVPLTKFRTPFDLVIASARLFGIDDQSDHPDPEKPYRGRLSGMMASLGQPVWNAPLPNGWSDRAADWTGPEAMMARIDWSYRLAGHPVGGEPGAIAMAALGPTLRPDTAQQIRQAGDRRDALTLLLTSPEFQRR